MKHNRFKHQAYIFCDMFCGWQNFADIPVLEDFELGKLVINVIRQVNFINGRLHKTLWITKAICDWYVEDLRKSKILPSRVIAAWLEVDFRVEQVAKNNVNCEFDCVGVVETSTVKYTAKYKNQSFFGREYSMSVSQKQKR